MKRIVLTTIGLLALCGCSPNSKTPDAIRQDAENATASAAKGAAVATQDAKAAVQGVQDGLRSLKPVDLNSASEADLESLPGIGEPVARKMIAARPFASASDLVDRHIVSKAEYDRISSRIEAR